MSKIYYDKRTGESIYDPNNWFERHSDLVYFGGGTIFALICAFLVYLIT